MRWFTAALAVAVVATAVAQVPTKKDLAKASKEYATAKSAYTKHPKDASAKKRFIKAATLYGHYSMTSPDLDRKIKYRQALRLYREVLKLDPKNPVAKPESDLIIRIYKSMGRPVPKD